jgi:hypothetical protein
MSMPPLFPADSEWPWLIGTLTVDLQDIVRKHGKTALQVWLAIEEQFLGNH